MSSGLNVVALISGGKDSLYSLLHCVQCGHNVVALANLYPKPRKNVPESQISSNLSQNPPEELQNQRYDDVDSFMYQTVGHTIIPMYSEALNLPLYRRMIHGTTSQTSKCYDASNLSEAISDETEDIKVLLLEVLKHHPEVNAVSAGAILSTYQRTRIESVAVRLGLTPLAFLWQYPALPSPNARTESLSGLLDDMAAAGCDARIIKIASGGIRESLLNSNVSEARTKSQLIAGLTNFFPNEEFGLRGAILGEGGEYETLAVNGPKLVWKKTIELEIDNPSVATGEGGVSYLQIVKAKLLEQPTDAKICKQTDLVRTPALIDLQFSALQQTFLNSTMEQSIEHPQTRKDDLVDELELTDRRVELKCTHKLSGNHVVINNIIAGDQCENADVINQIKSIASNLVRILDEISGENAISPPLTSSNIVSSLLLLESMSDFAVVNAVYSSLFIRGEPNPPARVTISCQMPEDIKVCLNVVLSLGPREIRRGLHVQSRSYWAPANIGPYSQAICETLESSDIHSSNTNFAEVVHMAGQIPLVPHTMELLETSFLEQAILSLQHLWRVGQERGVDTWPFGVAFLEQSQIIKVKAKTAYKVWTAVHSKPESSRTEDGIVDESSDEEPEFDAWDLKYNRFASTRAKTSRLTVGRHLHQLPNSKVFTSRTKTIEGYDIPSFIAAEVISLPRKAPIEWWSLGLGNLPLNPPALSSSTQSHDWGTITTYTHRQYDEDLNRQNLQKHFITIQIYESNSSENLSIDEIIKNSLLSVNTNNQREDLDIEQDIQHHEIVHGTAFISNDSGWRIWSKQNMTSLALIPCQNLWGSTHQNEDDIADHTLHDNAAEGIDSGSLKSLSFAIVARVDSDTSTTSIDNSLSETMA